MHVGICFPFMNQGEIDDTDLMSGELALGEMAEGLGFDSLWVFEHHFSKYIVSPNPLQLLSYFAGRTSRIQLGTMVVVIPWHQPQPVKLAEQVILLDHLCKGRFLLGVGRGVGRIEYENLAVDQGASKEIFVEMLKCLASALESGVCEYDGKHVKQPKIQIRPRPRGSFKERIFVGVGSPETSPLIAELRMGMLVVPQKPLPAHVADVESYQKAYRDVNDEDAPPRLVTTMLYLDEDEGRAKELGREAFDHYLDAIIDHYEFRGTHLKDSPDNKTFAAMQELISSPEGEKQWRDQIFELNPVGTPKQVRDQLMDMVQTFGAGRLVVGARYGAMSMKEGERNMRLFAEKVLPDLQKA